MLFARKHHEYGCPMCGRLPVIKEGETEKYHETIEAVKTITIYRLQCPPKPPFYKLVQRPYECKHQLETRR